MCVFGNQLKGNKKNAGYTKLRPSLLSFVRVLVYLFHEIRKKENKMYVYAFCSDGWMSERTE